jgi:RNA polymerase sigma factor (TIGR02999 family)
MTWQNDAMVENDERGSAPSRADIPTDQSAGLGAAKDEVDAARRPESTTGVGKSESSGNPDHLRAVDPALYEELRAIAARALRDEPRAHAPGTTSLVHEIWLRLARSDRNPVNDQQHLLALASLVARRALVDDARVRTADRRGGGIRPAPLPEDLVSAPMEPSSILAIDDLLTRLAERYPRPAKALEMRIFGAISPEHIGIALGISATQAKRDVAFARAWLVQNTIGLTGETESASDLA